GSNAAQEIQFRNGRTLPTSLAGNRCRKQQQRRASPQQTETGLRQSQALVPGNTHQATPEKHESQRGYPHSRPVGFLFSASSLSGGPGAGYTAPDTAVQRNPRAAGSAGYRPVAR